MKRIISEKLSIKEFFDITKDVAITALVTVAIFAVAAVVFALPSPIVMWAWNILMPPVFGLPKISLAQAIALMVLLGLVRTAVTYNGDRKDKEKNSGRH